MLLLVVVQQPAAAARRLGARRRLLLHAHRPLVGGEAELRRRVEGVPHHPHRRRRPDDRRDRLLLRRRHLRHRQDQRVRAEPARRPRPHARRRRSRSCSGSWARAASSSCTPGCPTPWPAHPGVGADPRGHDGGRRRVPRRPDVPGVLQRVQHRRRRREHDGADRWRHDPHRRAARVRAGRHQEGARVLHDQPARLHGDGARRRRVGRGGVPPLHARVLQGAAVPRRRLGQPRRVRTTPST